MPIAPIRRIAIRLTFLLLVPISAMWAAEKSTPTVDVCDLLVHPEQYANRIITVKGYVLATFEAFTLSSPDCPGLKVWLVYADDSEALRKNSDSNDMPLKISLKRDTHFKTFKEQIRNVGKCSGANIQSVLVARLDYLKTTIKHDGGGTQIIGFGQDGLYSTRLVIGSILESSPVPCKALPPPR